MSMLDGWPEAALKDFGGDFKPATLHVPGGEVSDGQGGFTHAPAADVPCLGIVTDWRDFRRQALGIPATDRLILVLAASLPAGVRPAKGHGITAQDPVKGLQPARFEIVDLTGDPAGALLKLQAH